MNQNRKTNIEILLGEWGRWKRGENRNPLGYPSHSAFMNMRVDGGDTCSPDVLLADDDVRRLDDWVPVLFPEARLVVTAHYVWPGPVKTKLDRIALSRTRYYDLLDGAHSQLSHWMGEGYVLMDQKRATILSGHIA